MQDIVGNAFVVGCGALNISASKKIMRSSIPSISKNNMILTYTPGKTRPAEN